MISKTSQRSSPEASTWNQSLSIRSKSSTRSSRPWHIAQHHKDIFFSVLTDSNLPRLVKGDALRLRQVFLNLTSNAIKFTETGSIEINLTSQIDGEDITLKYAIRDTGSGIPANRLEAIFEPFIQVDNTIIRIHGGTGLGLPISKRLVEFMGGSIRVESELGQGSTFLFDIRVSPVDTADVDIEDEPTITTFSRSLNIIVVEDNKFNRHVCRALLGKNHQIAEATNGLEALKLFHAQRDFDVILMDRQMPEMDGLSATAEIHRLEDQLGWPRTPVVALTANAMDIDRKRALDAGMDDFIAKPIRKKMLLTVLARMEKRLTDRV